MSTHFAALQATLDQFDNLSDRRRPINIAAKCEVHTYLPFGVQGVLDREKDVDLSLLENWE